MLKYVYFSLNNLCVFFFVFEYKMKKSIKKSKIQKKKQKERIIINVNKLKYSELINAACLRVELQWRTWISSGRRTILSSHPSVCLSVRPLCSIHQSVYSNSQSQQLEPFFFCLVGFVLVSLRFWLHFLYKINSI